MTARLTSTVIALVFAFAVVLPYTKSSPAVAAQPQPGPATSTLADQTEVALTVYNSDLALVRDVRSIQLPPGEAHLQFMDIAATVNPATVHLRSLTEPARLGILEQNYEYDLLEPEKILRKYVGRDVILVRPRQQNGTTTNEEVKARLLSYNTAPVWQIGNEVVTGLHADHMRFPELPDNLFVTPTLIWALDNTGTTRHRVQASYLASALKWNADYVLTVARDDKSADLDGWVTLTNNSGTRFKDASLQLVAGELNRVRQAFDQVVGNLQERVAPAASARIVQEAFADYHLYSVGRKTTVNNSETKQISLLGATAVPIIKRYVVDGQSFYYRNASSPGAPLKDPVKLFYQFRNETKSQLGMPMPAGVVRVYQADSKGGTQFVGEDRITHTPKDETLNLRVGTAFDVVAERKQTDFEKIAANVYEVAFEVALRNHKTTPVTVEVNEPIGGTWRILQSSFESTKSDAWAARFNVPVAANGTSTLTYRVRVTY